MPINAKVLVKRLVVLDAQERKHLMVEIDIECDACGKTQGVIAGHHLATLHKALGMILEEVPELCGTAADVHEETHFEGAVPAPGKARLN